MVRGEIYLYWITNLDWYDYDENEKPYLTEKAPEKARESFRKYIELKEKEKRTGVRII
ncbi:MAG: hypothetical protein NC177_08315 [Ruminococcus flavefaciens]|nr:hypothetical protein [Ruminococcus flavefaciens]